MAGYVLRVDREERLRSAIAEESVVDADEQVELVAELTRVRDAEDWVSDDTHPPGSPDT